mmetsp:Transcript_46840/g.100179  ORF Transcript_46840/g.100179 Transcript_46840/m.100179 type:complete len:83 (-) Transcript_46840:979-1227(-)
MWGQGGPKPSFAAVGGQQGVRLDWGRSFTPEISPRGTTHRPEAGKAAEGSDEDTEEADASAVEATVEGVASLLPTPAYVWPR